MGRPVEQIVGEFALGEQGVDREGFSSDVDGLKQRD